MRLSRWRKTVKETKVSPKERQKKEEKWSKRESWIERCWWLQEGHVCVCVYVCVCVCRVKGEVGGGGKDTWRRNRHKGDYSGWERKEVCGTILSRGEFFGVCVCTEGGRAVSKPATVLYR